MKVFISWSGERSLALAEALRDWLPLVLQYVEPWLSKADIDAGQRWDDELSKNLSECNFGISCVTNDNLLAPWLLFEAGALAKSVEAGKLVPLLFGLDLKDFSGPLSRFQAKKTDREGIFEILVSINKDASSAIPEGRLPNLLDMAWSNLEDKIAAIPQSVTPKVTTRKESEILEELVTGVRSVEARIRDISDDDFSSRRRRRFKSFPPMFLELGHMLSDGPDDPIQILVLASAFKDDLPWLYDIGLLAYRAITEGNAPEARKHLKVFQQGLEVTARGPFSRELPLDREMIHMSLMEMERFFDNTSLEKIMARPRLRVRRPSAQDNG